MITFTPVTIGACIHIAKNMRERDRVEVEAVLGLSDPVDIGYNMGRAHGYTGAAGFVCKLDNESVAVMTATFETPKSVQVALIATDDFNSVALAVSRKIKREVIPDLIARGVTRAECRCWEDHTDARRWLAILGAVEECNIPLYGGNGETFIQMAWRLPDVHERT